MLLISELKASSYRAKLLFCFVASSYGTKNSCWFDGCYGWSASVKIIFKQLQ